MKQHIQRLVNAITLAGSLGMVGPAVADTTVNNFDFFTSDALYANWVTATIDSGPTAYTITATNYGSNWKYNPVNAAGETTVELTVTISSSSTNEGKLGPIITFVDADGTKVNYAWFGQTNGAHVLTLPLAPPSWVEAPGTIAGFDPATLTHLHMQLDSSSYTGGYTIAWENLRLTGAPRPAITAQSFDSTSQAFTLTWTSLPGKFYTVLQAPDLATEFTPLVTDIPADGISTTTTVTMPPGNAGFLKIQQQ